MYVAMNRFKVALGSEPAFEDIWRNRQSMLAEVPGFVQFHMLRGKSFPDDGYTLYASHTTWDSETHFSEWTKSESFRAAHRNAGDHKAMYLGPPAFEGFNAVEGI